MTVSDVICDDVIVYMGGPVVTYFFAVGHLAKIIIT